MMILLLKNRSKVKNANTLYIGLQAEILNYEHPRQVIAIVVLTCHAFWRPYTVRPKLVVISVFPSLLDYCWFSTLK
jgi:hypothetical protein